MWASYADGQDPAPARSHKKWLSGAIAVAVAVAISIAIDGGRHGETGCRLQFAIYFILEQSGIKSKIT